MEEKELTAAAKVRKANANYRRFRHAVGWGYEGNYGNEGDFHKGLHKYSGRPTVHDDETLELDMKREFEYCKDHSLKVIKTNNYGSITSDLKTEWEFVVNPNVDKIYPGQEGHRRIDKDKHIKGVLLLDTPILGIDSKLKVLIKGIAATVDACSEDDVEIKTEGPNKKEVALLQLTSVRENFKTEIKAFGIINEYTLKGDQAEKLTLSNYKRVLKIFEEGALESIDPIVKGWIINIEVKASKNQRQNVLKEIHAADKIMRDKIRNVFGTSFNIISGPCGNYVFHQPRYEGRRPEKIETFLGHKMRKDADLTRAEVIGLRLYTGPAYKALNKALREKHFLKEKKGATFTTTIAVINSAILKLSKITPLAKSGLLYRGICGMSFPDKLLDTEKGNGFVEFAFSSASVDRDVALQYSGATRCQGPAECKSNCPYRVDNKKHIARPFVISWYMSGIEEASGVVVTSKEDADKYWLSTKKMATTAIDSLANELDVDEKQLTTEDKVINSRLLYHNLLSIKKGDKKHSMVACQYDDKGVVISRCSSPGESITKDWQEKMDSWRMANTPLESYYENACKSVCNTHGCAGWNYIEGFCNKHRSTLLEINTGQIDRGSQLRWVSQFPTEEEHVILPLSHFEITGMRRDEEHPCLNVLQINLNINLNAQTLKDIMETRKTIILDAMENNMQEISSFLTTKLYKYVSDHKDRLEDGKLEDGKKMVKLLIEECNNVVQQHRDSNAEDYNKDNYLFQMAQKEAATMCGAAIAKFEAWCSHEIPHATESLFSHLSLMQHTAKRLSKLKNVYDAEVNHKLNCDKICAAALELGLEKVTGLEKVHDEIAKETETNLDKIRVAALAVGVELGLVLNGDIDATFGPDKNTALISAVHRGDLNNVRLLLDAGCSIDERDGKGYTALTLCMVLRYKSITRLLIERGASLDVKTPRTNLVAGIGESSLIVFAASNEDVSLIKLVLDKAHRIGGASLEDKLLMSVDETGRSCLFVASGRPNLEVVEFLAAKGGDKLMKLTKKSGHRGDTCLHIAAYWGRLDIVKFLVLKFKDLLLKTNELGGSCLHNIAHSGDVTAADFLIEKGGKELLLLITNEKTWFGALAGSTCLSMAAKLNRQEAVKKFVEAYRKVGLPEDTITILQKQPDKRSKDEEKIVQQLRAPTALPKTNPPVTNPAVPSATTNPLPPTCSTTCPPPPTHPSANAATDPPPTITTKTHKNNNNHRQQLRTNKKVSHGCPLNPVEISSIESGEDGSSLRLGTEIVLVGSDGVDAAGEVNVSSGRSSGGPGSITGLSIGTSSSSTGYVINVDEGSFLDGSGGTLSISCGLGSTTCGKVSSTGEIGSTRLREDISVAPDTEVATRRRTTRIEGRKGGKVSVTGEIGSTRLREDIRVASDTEAAARRRRTTRMEGRMGSRQYKRPSRIPMTSRMAGRRNRDKPRWV